MSSCRDVLVGESRTSSRRTSSSDAASSSRLRSQSTSCRKRHTTPSAVLPRKNRGAGAPSGSFTQSRRPSASWVKSVRRGVASVHDRSSSARLLICAYHRFYQSLRAAKRRSNLLVRLKRRLLRTLRVLAMTPVCRARVMPSHTNAPTQWRRTGPLTTGFQVAA